jgi:DNA polymerase IV
LVFWEQVIPKDRGVQVKKLSVVLHGLVQQDLVQPDLFDIFDAKPLVPNEVCKSSYLNEHRHSRLRKNDDVLFYKSDFESQHQLKPIKTRDSVRMNSLSVALDRINHRFGRDSALIGMLPSSGRSFSGTKIAFTRIPDIEEFLE